MATDYLQAEALLVDAERRAWDAGDWDTLSRLYMPLQETRRQRRQRCGEGVVQLDLIGTAESAEAIVARVPRGQLLVAGRGSIELSLEVRRLAREKKLYLETFLSAAYEIQGRRVAAIVPRDSDRVPTKSPATMDAFRSELPAEAIVIELSQLPTGPHRGSDETYARRMSIWEQLHKPLLAAADAVRDPIERMAAYRNVIEADYACELAHQNLSRLAKSIGRGG